MVRVASFTLRIMGPNDALDRENQDVFDSLSDSPALSHAEDAINDFLPDGYYCKIDET